MENNYNTNSGMRLHRQNKSECQGCFWEDSCCDKGCRCEDFYNPSEEDDEDKDVGGSDYIDSYIEINRVEYEYYFWEEIAEYGEQWN